MQSFWMKTYSFSKRLLSRLSWYCRLSVCLYSVTKCIALNNRPTSYYTEVSQPVKRKCRIGTRCHSFQLSTRYTGRILQTPHLLNHRRCYHQANTLKKHTCTASKRTAKISTSGSVVVSIMHTYYRQLRTIGFFSATSGLHVWIGYTVYQRQQDPLSRPGRSSYFTGCLLSHYTVFICFGE